MPKSRTYHTRVASELLCPPDAILGLSPIQKEPMYFAMDLETKGDLSHRRFPLCLHSQSLAPPGIRKSADHSATDEMNYLFCGRRSEYRISLAHPRSGDPRASRLIYGTGGLSSGFPQPFHRSKGLVEVGLCISHGKRLFICLRNRTARTCNNRVFFLLFLGDCTAKFSKFRLLLIIGSAYLEIR